MEMSELYDFCLVWQMNGDKNRDIAWFKNKFNEYGWDFYEFKKEATKNRWFVKSMEQLS